MKSHRSIAHFLSTLLLAIFIATPAPMFAQEGSVDPPVSSEVGTSNQEQNPEAPGTGEGEAPADLGTGEGEAPADPGTGEGEAPADPGTGEGEAPADPGTGEGEAPADPGTGEGEAPADPGTGEGEAPAAPGTGEGEAPAAPGSGEGENPAAPGPGAPELDGSEKEAPATDSADDGGFSILAEQGTGDPAYYCDFRNQPAGDVASWWAANDVAPDCIDLTVTNSPETCSLTVTYASYVTLSNGSYSGTANWYETDANGVVLRSAPGQPPLNWDSTGATGPGGKSITATFPEDHNGGTTYVLVNFGSPENQIAPGLSEFDLAHWRTTSSGVVYKVNTDCELPDPNFYCDYANLTGAGDVYSWLASAPEGANTDCIDVGTAVQACGSLNIPFESRVTGFNSGYVLLWAEGSTIPADDSTWNSSWPIQFAEDYNNGSVDVIVFIGGPEDDYYHFANEDPYPYPYPNQDRGDIPARSLGGGVKYTIDTDCVEPVPSPAELALPTIVESVCDDQYRPTPASVTAPENSDSVSYSGVTASTSGNNITFQFTATANRGFTLEGVTLPEGYTLVDNASATYSITLTLADCQVPPTVVSPQIPVLVPATCGEADAGKVAEPTLEIPTTEGVTYSEVTVSPANSVKLSLTATANEGYTFVGATLPEGWTLVGSSEAVYEIVADTLDCPTPEPTETPEPGTPAPTETPEPGTPAPTEEPKAEEAPEVKGLPETGTGSNPASMIGLAAIAAGAIASAGLYFTNRKRS